MNVPYLEDGVPSKNGRGLTYLSHSGEETLWVEESRHPEDVGSTLETPGPELAVPLQEIRVPETQGAGVPGDLRRKRKTLSNFKKTPLRSTN